MDETFMMFKLYNKIEPEAVMEMFKGFPYLFCCDMIKLRKFLAEFKKYKMTEAQIVNLVSLCVPYPFFTRLQEAGVCLQFRFQALEACLTICAIRPHYDRSQF